MMNVVFALALTLALFGYVEKDGLGVFVPGLGGYHIATK